MLVRLSMGEEVSRFLKESPVKVSSDCMESLGLCYHKFRGSFSDAALPSVNLLAGSSSLRLQHVVALNIVDDKERSQGKVESVIVTLRGVPSHSEVSVAKAFAYDVINDVLDAGWERYVYRFDPRIVGRESEKFEACCSEDLRLAIMSLPRFDPHYVMSDEQWQQTGSYRWYFYRDGYYLTLEAWSSRGVKVPVGQASYLFRVNIKSEKEKWLGAFEYKDKPQWHELLPALLEQYRLQRQSSEDYAQRAGVEIDRTYKDAPISALNE